MKDNIQIVYTQEFDTYLLVRWKKEQIEVGLLGDLDVQYVEGPSFGFYYRDSKMKRFSYTKNNIQRVWEKNRSSWVKLYTTLTNNTNIECTKYALRYRKNHILFNVIAKYDFRTQSGIGWVDPNENSMAEWIAIMNPSIKNMELKSFKITL